MKIHSVLVSMAVAVVLVLCGGVVHAQGAVVAQELAGRIEAANTFLKTAGNAQPAALSRSVLMQRKKAMQELAAVNPALFLQHTLSPDTVRALSGEFQAEVETPVTLTGTLDVLVRDDLETFGHAGVEYVLKTGKDRVVVYPTSELDTRSGGTWRVEGVRLGDILVADKKNMRATALPPALDSVGEQKTLILLLDYTNSTPSPLSAGDISNEVFRGPVQSFFKEQSYGNVRFTGTALGWFRLNRPDDCRFYNIDSPEFSQLILQNNINLGQYKRLVLAVNGPCTPSGLGTVGMSTVTVGGKTYSLSVAWLAAKAEYFSIPWGQGGNWNFWDHSLAHELGHNLGAYHSNGWNCDQSTFSGNCSHVEYGNYFDAMGRGSFASHFSALTKEKLGWIAPSDVLTITQSGRYTIGPLNVWPTTPLVSLVSDDRRVGSIAEVLSETSAGSGGPTKKSAKIKIASGETPFFLEYRRGVGFDRGLNQPDLAGNQNGLFINWAAHDPSSSQDPLARLLDIVPTSAEWAVDLYDATLNASPGGSGRVFVDEGRGITIGPVISNNASRITFDVTITPPVCNRQAPTFSSLENAFPRLPAGSTAGYLVAHFENADSLGCGESEFEVTTNLPAAWNPTLIPSGTAVLYPANSPQHEEVTRLISFVVPANTPPGSDQAIIVKVRNIASGLETTRTATVHVAGAPHITALSPESGPVDTLVTIAGTELGGSPVILMSGQTGSAWVSPLKVSDTSLTIQIPATLTGYACNCTIPTPVGEYGILVFVNGFVSEQLPFEITAVQADVRTKTDLKDEKPTQPLSVVLGNAISAYVAGVGRLIGL